MLGPWGFTQTTVYFVCSGSSWVLVDAGWGRDASRIKRAAESLFGAGSPPATILLTHDHPDHDGSPLELSRTRDCPVHSPGGAPDRQPLQCWRLPTPLDRWAVLPLMRAMGRRRREAIFAQNSLSAVARMFPNRAPRFPACRTGSASTRMTCPETAVLASAFARLGNRRITQRSPVGSCLAYGVPFRQPPGAMDYEDSSRLACQTGRVAPRGSR